MTDAVFTQVGLEVWPNFPVKAVFTHVSADVWFNVRSSAAFSQVGAEVWHSVAETTPPPVTGNNGIALLIGL